MKAEEAASGQETVSEAAERARAEVESVEGSETSDPGWDLADRSRRQVRRSLVLQCFPL